MIQACPRGSDSYEKPVVVHMCVCRGSLGRAEGLIRIPVISTILCTPI